MEHVLDLIKPELIVLIPCLYYLKKILKSLKVKKKIIFLVILVLGITMSCFYEVTANVVLCAEKRLLMKNLFGYIIQGILCSFAAIYYKNVFNFSKLNDLKKNSNKERYVILNKKEKIVS